MSLLKWITTNDYQWHMRKMQGTTGHSKLMKTQLPWVLYYQVSKYSLFFAFHQTSKHFADNLSVKVFGRLWWNRDGLDDVVEDDFNVVFAMYLGSYVYMLLNVFDYRLGSCETCIITEYFRFFLRVDCYFILICTYIVDDLQCGAGLDRAWISGSQIT